MSTSTNVEECSVNWSSHSNHWKQVFDRMLVANDFVDATIYCDGRKLHVHKVVLSAFSTYFYEVFKDITCEQPVIILKGIDYDVLYALVQFMYRGEVNLERTKLNTFLKAAEFLQVCGLKMVAPESTSSTSHIASNKDALNTTTATTTTSSSSCGSGNRASAEETTSVVPSSVPTDFTAEDTSSSGDTAKDSSPRKKRQKISANESQSEKSSTSRAASEIQDTAESIQIKCEPEDEAVSVDEFYETIKSKQSVITPARHSDPLSSTDQGHTSDGNKRSTSVYTPETVNQSWPVMCVKCNICDKVFSHPYSLQQHKPVHAGTTKCPICSAVLSRKYHLKLHMRSRHNII